MPSRRLGLTTTLAIGALLAACGTDTTATSESAAPASELTAPSTSAAEPTASASSAEPSESELATACLDDEAIDAIESNLSDLSDLTADQRDDIATALRALDAEDGSDVERWRDNLADAVEAGDSSLAPIGALMSAEFQLDAFGC